MITALLFFCRLICTNGSKSTTTGRILTMSGKNTKEPAQRIKHTKEEITGLLTEIIHSLPRSREDILSSLKISNSTLKNYQNILQGLGYPIESHKGILSLSAQKPFSPVLDEYTLMTKYDVLKLITLMAVNSDSYTFIEIDNRIRAFLKRSLLDENNEQLTNYSLRNKTIRELEDACLLTHTGVRYNNQDIRFLDIYQSTVFTYAVSCWSYPVNPPPILEKINNYFMISLIRSRPTSEYMKLGTYLKKLNELHYTENAISLSYRSGKSCKKIHFFFIGLIAYESDKDIIYFIGRDRPTKTSYLMIRADKIQWDSEMQQNATPISPAMRSAYSEEFRNIKKEMFNISCDSPEKVIVSFVYNETNESLLHHLQQERPDTSCVYYVTDCSNRYTDISDVPPSESVEKIYYHDTIRGIADFAKYIRKFGDDAFVEENALLKKQMIETANRTLQNYEMEFDKYYGKI